MFTSRASRWASPAVVAAAALLVLLALVGCGALLGSGGAGEEATYVSFSTADRDPAWSPHGTEVAFERNGAVHAVRPDGSCRRRVTAGGEPAWSPDGDRLAVTRCRGESCAVVVVSMGGSEERELVRGPFSAPVWSADGTHLYLSRSEADLSTTTWVVRANGSVLRRLAPPWVEPGDRRWSIAAASEDDPTFSPDGTRYAFAASNDPTVGVDELEEAVFVRAVRGGRRWQLSDPPDDAGDYEPAWSPDGTRIAFQRSGQIAVMDADGSDERVLTKVNGATDPAWSPDGREIVFTNELSGGGYYGADPSALMIVDVDSRDLRKLTWDPRSLTDCPTGG